MSINYYNLFIILQYLIIIQGNKRNFEVYSESELNFNFHLPLVLQIYYTASLEMSLAALFELV
jgi:hypothetical protein